MKTIIIEVTKDYTTEIDTLDYKTTAEAYVEGTIEEATSKGATADFKEGAVIMAKVYEDESDPMFDEPISITTGTILHYSEAADLVVSDEEIAKEFTKWLSMAGKKAWEWDADDLGEYMRSIGYITIL